MTECKEESRCTSNCVSQTGVRPCKPLPRRPLWIEPNSFQPEVLYSLTIGLGLLSSFILSWGIFTMSCSLRYISSPLSLLNLQSHSRIYYLRFDALCLTVRVPHFSSRTTSKFHRTFHGPPTRVGARVLDSGPVTPPSSLGRTPYGAHPHFPGYLRSRPEECLYY